MKYYGVDWVAFVLNVVGIYLVGNKSRPGMFVAALGNAIWIIIGVVSESYGLAAACTLVVAMYIRGWVRWSKPETGEHK